MSNLKLQLPKLRRIHKFQQGKFTKELYRIMVVVVVRVGCLNLNQSLAWPRKCSSIGLLGQIIQTGERNLQPLLLQSDNFHDNKCKVVSFHSISSSTTSHSSLWVDFAFFCTTGTAGLSPHGFSSPSFGPCFHKTIFVFFSERVQSDSEMQILIWNETLVCHKVYTALKMWIFQFMTYFKKVWKSAASKFPCVIKTFL